MNLILRAARFADHAHRGQVRKESTGRPVPYITHPDRVAARVARLPEATEEMVAAAWLHDVVEDCGVYVSDLMSEFGNLVGAYVGLLTNEPKSSGLTKAQRRAKDLDRIRRSVPEVRIIKLADRIDNTRDSLTAGAEFRRNYALKAATLREALRGTHAVLEDELDAAIADLAEKAQP